MRYRIWVHHSRGHLLVEERCDARDPAVGNAPAGGGFAGVPAAARRPWVSAAAIRLGDADLLADASGGLIWPARRLVVVADLHLEKGSAFARRGQLLPPYDTRSTLSQLEALLRRCRPRRVISLGDGFHDRHGSERLATADRARLQALIRCCDWLWLSGNHDPEPPARLGGRSAPEVRIDGLVFRHVPGGAPASGELAGHLHPVARLRRRGRSVGRPCFVCDGRRLLLPAFGAYTGGLDVLAPPIRHLFESEPATYLLGRSTVHRVPLARLAG